MKAHIHPGTLAATQAEKAEARVAFYERTVQDASIMLLAFKCAGATTFNVTRTAVDGAQVSFFSGVSGETLDAHMDATLHECERSYLNLIIRPHSDSHYLIQLNDLTVDTLALAKPVAFMSSCTSPGNYQAWVALPTGWHDDIQRRLRKMLGAKLTTSGATRIAGSRNFSTKYAPEFPTVTLEHVSATCEVTPEQLLERGLLSPVQQRKAVPHSATRKGSGGLAWPDYARCIDSAPRANAGTGEDISQADLLWCVIAARWGWPAKCIADRLRTLSPNFQRNGELYVQLTVSQAFAEAMLGQRR